MRDANARSEARKKSDRRHGRSKLVISLLKRNFEKVPILLNNRGIFMEWYIDMGDHIQALTLGLWMQWPGGPVDLKTYWPRP